MIYSRYVTFLFNQSYSTVPPCIITEILHTMRILSLSIFWFLPGHSCLGLDHSQERLVERRLLQLFFSFRSLF